MACAYSRLFKPFFVLPIIATMRSSYGFEVDGAGAEKRMFGRVGGLTAG
jgi:hypothetical protein